MLYEELQVSKQVSVILWSDHKRRYKTFCVCYYQSVLHRWYALMLCGLRASCLVQMLK